MVCSIVVVCCFTSFRSAAAFLLPRLPVVRKAIGEKIGAGILTIGLLNLAPPNCKAMETVVSDSVEAVECGNQDNALVFIAPLEREPRAEEGKQPQTDDGKATKIKIKLYGTQVEDCNIPRQRFQLCTDVTNADPESMKDTSNVVLKPISDAFSKNIQHDLPLINLLLVGCCTSSQKLAIDKVEEDFRRTKERLQRLLEKKQS